MKTGTGTLCLILGLLALMFAGPLMAQELPSSLDRATCDGTEPAFIIRGCTAVIERQEGGRQGMASAYFKRALARDRIEEREQALGDLQQARALGFDAANVANARGYILHQLGRYDEAIAAYTEAIESRLTFSEAYYNRGVSLFSRSRFKAARADFNAALRLNPQFDYAKTMLANVDAMDAKAAAKEVTVSPDSRDAELCADPASADAAIAACTRIIASGVSGDALADAHLNRARAYQAKKIYYSAKPDAEAALALRPDHADTIALAQEVTAQAQKQSVAFNQVIAAMRAQNAAKEGKTQPSEPASGTKKDLVGSLFKGLEIGTKVDALKLEREQNPDGSSISDQLSLAPSKPDAVVPAGKRVALVIGNSKYANTPALVNPKNDAEDVASALGRLGFTVIHETDLDKRGMDDAFRRFAREVVGADAALFYYAGHALQFAGINYLMPVDAKLADEVDLPYEMAKLDDVLADMSRVNGIRIAVLDSCRNNPLEERLKSQNAKTRDGGLTRGLARITNADGLLIAYSTQHGQVAVDGEGRNSPFTSALLKNIDTPGLEIGLLFRRVAQSVHRETEGKQLPEVSVSLLSEFYFRP